MGSELVPAALKAVANEMGVLRALYDDLASPGVRQVGRALGTVLETGNIVLLPLRMLNHAVAQHEKGNFESIAKRFERIPDADIVEIRPEMGVPILERLAYTSDESLRKMFIELLASSADVKKVGMAHPSFVRVIESLSPNEAKILQSWRVNRLVPCVGIFRKGPDSSSSTIYDVLYDTEDDSVEVTVLSAFVSNMEGLGLIRHRAMDSVADDGAYDKLLKDIRRTFPEIKRQSFSFVPGRQEKIVENDYYYVLGCIEILDYGKLFEECCFP